MSVGYPITKAGMDSIFGQEIGALWNAFEVIRNRKVWLDDPAHSDANLLTPLGWSGSEITTLRAAYTDLDSLRQISHNTGTKGVATLGLIAAGNDFFFNAKGLGGPNWYG